MHCSAAKFAYDKCNNITGIIDWTIEQISRFSTLSSLGRQIQAEKDEKKSKAQN